MVTLVNPGLPPISLSDGLFDTRFNKFKIGEGYVYFKLTSAPALAGQFVQHRFRNPTGSGKTWFLTKAHVRSTIANFLGITNPVSPALAALGTALSAKVADMTLAAWPCFLVAVVIAVPKAASAGETGLVIPRKLAIVDRTWALVRNHVFPLPVGLRKRCCTN